MRVHVIAAAVAIAVTGTAANSEPTPSQKEALERVKAQCPRTTSYLAEKVGRYQGQPLTPKKLNELPPAQTYMAVYRHIGGCEAPLTMVEYRSPKRR